MLKSTEIIAKQNLQHIILVHYKPKYYFMKAAQLVAAEIKVKKKILLRTFLFPLPATGKVITYVCMIMNLYDGILNV